MSFAINGVRLDGVLLPQIAHKGATFSVQDIDSAETGRNQSGDMIRERVAVKIKWQLTFPPLSRAMMSALLNAMSEPEFDFTYPDPFKASGTTTKRFYVGDRTVPVYSTAKGLPLWENVSFSVVEL